MNFFYRKGIERRYARKRETDFRWQIFRGLLRLLVIGAFLAIVWYVTRIPALTIAQVSVSGGETISHDLIHDRVETELAGTHFLLVPKRFSYLYPRDRIVEVVEDIPRVHSVSVARSSRTGLVVSFAEYAPHALWCVEKVDTSCWLINSEGYAFAPAPHLTGGTFVRHTAEGGEELGEGSVIDAGRLSAIDRFLARAEAELGLRMTSLMHRTDGDIELFINGGGSVLVSGGKDFELTFENLRTVLSAPEFQHLRPGNFRYIDVRFDSKVFVNEELEVEPVATTTATSTLPE